jgi:hypothetical protein
MKAPIQRGQAMVEAAVILGIVVMLFLGIWYLGKFHDVQAATIQSARYAAWERTVHSNGNMSNTQLQNQARARLFTWNSDAFKSTDGLKNGDAWTAQNPNWRDHGQNARLIDKPDDVVISTSIGPLAGKAANYISDALGMVSGFLDGITGGEALPKGGTATGTVSVKLNNIAALPAPLDKLNLTLRESHSLVLDSWDASGPRQAALRSRTYTLAGPITQINGLMDPLKWALSWIEPSFNDLQMGQVCPDIVPADRVQGAGVLPAYRGGGACVR